jgi:exoribonuclease R
VEEAEQVQRAAEEGLDAEIKKRTAAGDNFQSKRIFTIDPATARDLDDAVHIEVLEGGKVAEIGVHIADVTHYVTPGSKMDNEAKFRCTTLYLPDRVMPMLPRILSNGICSLHSGSPKLTFSTIFRLNMETGELMKEPAPRFCRSVIETCVRLSYDEVQDALDGEDVEPPPVAVAIHGRMSKTICTLSIASAVRYGREE